MESLRNFDRIKCSKLIVASGKTKDFEVDESDDKQFFESLKKKFNDNGISSRHGNIEWFTSKSKSKKKPSVFDEETRNLIKIFKKSLDREDANDKATSNSNSFEFIPKCPNYVATNDRKKLYIEDVSTCNSTFGFTFTQTKSDVRKCDNLMYGSPLDINDVKKFENYGSMLYDDIVLTPTNNHNSNLW